MSLLGRLEDLSLTDIVQIVFLSRRTGVLEIIDAAGRHTVLFRHGMVVNAADATRSDLVTFLQNRGDLSEANVEIIREMEQQGIAAGNTIIEMNLMTSDRLLKAIQDRILDVVRPLLQSREGEFNFVLSDSLTPVDMGYDADALHEKGGFSPQKIIGLAEGEKIKPLRGLEESLQAGKMLRRPTSPGTTPVPAALDVGLGNTPPPPAPPAAAETPQPAPSKKTSSQFKVAGGLFETESPDASFKNVILFERDPLVRVAVKRAFGKRGVKISQYGSLDDLRNATNDLIRSHSYFITLMELTDDDATLRTLQLIKRRNPRLPVAIVGSADDPMMREQILSLGADHYVPRPSTEQLPAFADEMVAFAEGAFEDFEGTMGLYGFDAGKRFYELAEKESVERNVNIIQQLINELNDPNDISQVAAMILRLSSEYLDRGALFVITNDGFLGLSGFGTTGQGDSIEDRVPLIQIERHSPSILEDVAASRHPHRGKLKRTDANARLLQELGTVLPTEVVALPILHDEQSVGILYGDNAEHRAPIDSTTGLEIFLSQAGYAFGNAVLAWQRSDERGRGGS